METVSPNPPYSATPPLFWSSRDIILQSSGSKGGRFLPPRCEKDPSVSVRFYLPGQQHSFALLKENKISLKALIRSRLCDVTLLSCCNSAPDQNNQ